MKTRLPGHVYHFAEILENAGYQCVLVGGAVRDLLLGKGVKDFDFATDAQPAEVQRLFKRVIPTGIQHGTVTVLYRGERFEVTTFRRDGKYSNARHPDKVDYTDSLTQDLQRRDFTVNAIAYRMEEDRIYDPIGGRDDLKKGVIRAIGDPAERFQEDGLRLMRACRFAVQLEFRIDDKTLAGMEANRKAVASVSAERIREELERILTARKPSAAFRIMEKTGLLGLIFPEIEACRGVIQKGFHRYDVYEHILYSCDGAPADNAVVRLAALLHDIGKVPAKAVDPEGGITFYNHERHSARMARELMQRLKFSKAVENSVVHLIEQHMFNYTDDWSDGAVRRFIARVGIENLDDLFLLREADQFGTDGIVRDKRQFSVLKRRIRGVLEENNALSVKDLAVDGHGLHREAGIPRSWKMGKVLEYLLEAVMDDPGLNEPERLLDIARRFYDEHYG